MMNRILFPTDFSDHAKRAYVFAANVAQKMGAQLDVFHSYHITTPAGSFASFEDIVEEDLRKDMNAFMDAVTNANAEQVSYETWLLDGSITDALKRFNKKKPFEMIVMGTKGAGKIQGALIGSTTSQVLDYVTKPVLAIPDTPTFKPFKKIVLAIDTVTQKTPEAIAPLVALANAYDSEIIVYHQSKPNGQSEQSFTSTIGDLLAAVPHRVVFDNSGEDISSAIANFAHAEDANLLCMIHHHRGFWQKLFSKSVTKQNAFVTDIPLLVLQE